MTRKCVKPIILCFSAPDSKEQLCNIREGCNCSVTALSDLSLSLLLKVYVVCIRYLLIHWG